MESLGHVIVRMPSASTFRRALHRVDIQALEREMARLGQELDADEGVTGSVVGPQGEELRGQAVDGKEVRGASAHGEKVKLVSLVRHGSGAVLGQQKVAPKSHEIVCAPQLLQGRELKGTVTTFDAAHTHKPLAQQIIDQHGDYVMLVKKNQRTLYTDIKTFFEDPTLPRREDDRNAYTYPGKGHGRLETRTLVCSAVLTPYLHWPGGQQVFQRTCRRLLPKSGKVSEKATYGLTSLSRQRAEAYHLEQFCRGHWTIENEDHYVRDETLKEDRCQMHKGNAPEALAALKNGLLTALRYHGWTNIADALRYYAASVASTFAFLAGNAS